MTAKTATAKRRATAKKSAVSSVETLAPRVVYTQAPVQLGALLGRADGEGRWRVRAGFVELLAQCDPSVDPTLLDEACVNGARVVLDTSAGAPVIVGTLAVSRSLTVSREGDVDAKVRSLKIAAETEALVQTPHAFLRLQGDEVELSGGRVLTRARELLKLLGRMVKVN
jgi:hypothetical protein